MSLLQRPKIIVVEDNEVDIEAFLRLAKRLGIKDKVTIYPDAETALDAIKAMPAVHGVAPSLILTDLNMPGIDGHEFIAEIRKTQRIAHSMIVVVSTSDLDADIKRAYAQGVAGYVVKDTGGEYLEHVMRMARHYCEAVAIAA